MDNKPSLSQYFGETEVPPASQFFDEIGTSPSDMIQSVYLGESEVSQPAASNIFPTNMTASFSQLKVSDEMKFGSVVPTVSGTTALPATSLPDPSTFFDTIGPEPHMVMATPNILIEAMDVLAVKDQPVDKEADRRRDAWIPSDEAKKVLLKAQSCPKGAFFPEREALTLPGVIFDEELPDSLHAVAVKYLGVSAAGRGGMARADAARGEAGLRELLRAGCLRAAINLSATLLAQHKQGPGRAGRLPGARHSARSLQLWLARFCAMLRVRLAAQAAQEAEAFGDCGQPDMYYEFYPDQYENRTGSMVPFALRLLIAEMPAHAGRPEKALPSLYAVLAVVQQMLANLKAGKTEDGSAVLAAEQDRAESLRLWAGRETRVQHSIVNCAIALKDYRLASKIISGLQEAAASAAQKRALASAQCRLWLLAGHCLAAATHLQQARELRQQLCPTPDVREYVDLGLLEVAQGRYKEAYENFIKANDQEPTNIMVANNLAVCLLYLGRLKEAIAALQAALRAAPERALGPRLLLNLCTLYELESSKNMDKKLNLLRMLCKYKSDTIPNVMECLKLS
ncbi:trafficking protein particle complex subunit 12 [Cydia pomonella]|uniref:trafficking protein particle complex subunit 12 n=1 Tax=Cydia pomonella TaxID=82600 RepID=UPI002ADDA564|nr:trafficking protein particle complex subunit 12 [Cydia pomonella]